MDPITSTYPEKHNGNVIPLAVYDATSSGGLHHYHNSQARSLGGLPGALPAMDRGLKQHLLSHLCYNFHITFKKGQCLFPNWYISNKLE